jgi:hypothetical protein
LKIDVDYYANGTIREKKVRFSNYVGKENHAGFHYGVNLKQIVRTQESKNIVTKLIVKSNNNKYAKNGFCTVARAHSNESGETSLYNFQYYLNCGLLNASNFTNYVYNTPPQLAYGQDTGYGGTTTNAKNYFQRLKAINTKLLEWNEELSGINLELVNLRADQYTAETKESAARDEAATLAREFAADYPTTTIENWPIVVTMVPEGDVLLAETAKKRYFEWLQVKNTESAAKTEYNDLTGTIQNRTDRQKFL